jgi:hypothetical protein
MPKREKTSLNYNFLGVSIVKVLMYSLVGY